MSTKPKRNEFLKTVGFFSTYDFYHLFSDKLDHLCFLARHTKEFIPGSLDAILIVCTQDSGYWRWCIAATAWKSLLFLNLIFLAPSYAHIHLCF